MQPKTTLVSTRSSKKNTWTREDPTHLNLSVSVRRVRETVQGECVTWIRQKKGQFYRSSVWRISNLLQKHHISTHTSRRGRFRSEDRGSAVILWPRGRCEVERQARGYRDSGCSGRYFFNLTPLCIVGCWPPTTLCGYWVGKAMAAYCQKHNLTLKWNFHLKQDIQNQGRILFCNLKSTIVKAVLAVFI